MSKIAVAKLFRNGRSQAVRLPREFRFEGEAVRVRRVGNGVLLEPIVTDPETWFQNMDRHGAIFDIERNQPITPIRDVFE